MVLSCIKIQICIVSSTSSGSSYIDYNLLSGQSCCSQRLPSIETGAEGNMAVIFLGYPSIYMNHLIRLIMIQDLLRIVQLLQDQISLGSHFSAYRIYLVSPDSQLSDLFLCNILAKSHMQIVRIQGQNLI